MLPDEWTHTNFVVSRRLLERFRGRSKTPYRMGKGAEELLGYFKTLGLGASAGECLIPLLRVRGSMAFYDCLGRA